MATSDRTQYKQVVAGSFGDGRDVVNAQLCIAQDAQRFAVASFGAAAIGATSNTNVPMLRVDRPVVVKEVRILPGGTLAAGTGGNYVTVTLGYTNDASNAITSVATVNNNTTANGGTGAWAFGTSLVVPVIAANVAVPANSQFVVQSVITGAAGSAIPTYTDVQMIMEEV